jgi:hypothetical protein
MFLRQTPVGSVKDPATGDQQEKHVFVVFYAGERARTKVLKVRDSSSSGQAPPSLQQQLLQPAVCNWHTSYWHLWQHAICQPQPRAVCNMLL